MSGKAVVQFRQRRKRWAVDAFGGKCGICDYDKCVEALEFHHLDPSQKDFTLTSCLLYTSPSPRDRTRSRMPSSA